MYNQVLHYLCILQHTEYRKNKIFHTESLLNCAAYMATDPVDSQ